MSIVIKNLIHLADYASFVNNDHKIVEGKGGIIRW